MNLALNKQIYYKSANDTLLFISYRINNILFNFEILKSKDFNQSKDEEELKEHFTKINSTIENIIYENEKLLLLSQIIYDTSFCHRKLANTIKSSVIRLKILTIHIRRLYSQLKNFKHFFLLEPHENEIMEIVFKEIHYLSDLIPELIYILQKLKKI